MTMNEMFLTLEEYDQWVIGKMKDFPYDKLIYSKVVRKYRTNNGMVYSIIYALKDKEES